MLLIIISMGILLTVSAISTACFALPFVFSLYVITAGSAVNPIRDTIFASNPELYYNLGEISTTVA